jgi:hypothetical protein
MLRELNRLVSSRTEHERHLVLALDDINPQVQSLAVDAKKLLELEATAIGHGYITPLKTNDPEIQALRERLFSNRKRFGGAFKEVLDKIDTLVLALLRGR